MTVWSRCIPGWECCDGIERPPPPCKWQKAFLCLDVTPGDVRGAVPLACAISLSTHHTWGQSSWLCWQSSRSGSLTLLSPLGGACLIAYLAAVMRAPSAVPERCDSTGSVLHNTARGAWHRGADEAEMYPQVCAKWCGESDSNCQPLKTFAIRLDSELVRNGHFIQSVRPGTVCLLPP